MFGLILALDMNKLYLVGLPASGKTTTAKWLANKLGWTFVDLDEMIESKMGLSVSGIFETHGEDFFREIEAKCLRDTLRLNNIVVGCGGGTAAYHDNMDWMKMHGLTLFLNTSLEVLVARIGADMAKRPMFSGENESEILNKLSQIAENRSIYYSSAKIVWNRSEPSDLLYRVVNQMIA